MGEICRPDRMDSQDISSCASRQKKADERVERAFAAFVQTLLTLLIVVFLGRWFAWGYMIGQLVLTVGAGIYAFGMKRGSDA